MRQINAAMLQKLKSLQQTAAAGCEPKAIVTISRGVSLINADTAKYLEKAAVTDAAASDVSVAARHMTAGKAPDRVYVAYVSAGHAYVRNAAPGALLSTVTWSAATDCGTAECVALAFDGMFTRPKDGRQEFITESTPWVFRVASGALYGRKVGGDEVTLATENVTAVSACCLPGGYGLSLFFIDEGVIYVRQYISGVWYDAAPIEFGVTATWIDVVVERTWDYRAALMCRDDTGALYNAYSYYSGFDELAAEHIEVSGVDADGELTHISYTDVKTDEHVEITGVSAGAPHGGLYPVAAPAIVFAANADNGGGDWGKVVVITLDVFVEPTSVAASYAAFTLTDSLGSSFAVMSASVGDDGKTVTLGISDFNAASGDCTVAYTPGTAQTMAGTAFEAMSAVFTPQHLIPPPVDPPAAQEAWNG